MNDELLEALIIRNSGWMGEFGQEEYNKACLLLNNYSKKIMIQRELNGLDKWNEYTLKQLEVECRIKKQKLEAELVEVNFRLEQITKK